MKLQTAKGVRDIPPEKKIARNRVVDTLKRVFELFGYNPLETPNIEKYDLLSSKYAGGDEILKETFKFKDQGKRELGLRYDLTVPFCRFVGMNPTLKMPFKRYQVGRVFRDGPIKLGRYREFWQCDVDIVGCKEMTADAEILALTSSAFRKLGMDVMIKVNNRKLLNGILEEAGIEKNKEDVILSIDKLEKIGKDDVIKELAEKGVNKNSITKALDLFKVKGDDNLKNLKFLKGIIKNDEGKQGIKELEDLFRYLKSFNVENVKLEVSLARGLAYYTGTVFETFLIGSDIKNSVAAGGRYDNMISQFLGTDKEYPAMGISFGLDVITDAIRIKKEDDEEEKSIVKIFIIPIGTLEESLKIAGRLRQNGINIDIDLSGRGVSRNLGYANYYKIPYVIFVGESELKENKVKLRNMKSGEENLVAVDELLKIGL